MARLARVVIPGLPHHVTQRGNGRQRTFFSDDDYKLYRRLLAEACRESDVACWAYVLMPNHVHAILVPQRADGLRAALARTHRAYAGIVNARRGRTGHFWQGRFGAVAMDEAHLATAFAYVLLNPVRARLVDKPADWAWSSARAYLRGINDGLTETAAIRERIADVAAVFSDRAALDAIPRLRAAETIGRPLGSAEFLARLERRIGRTLAPAKRGPKPREGIKCTVTELGEDEE